VVAKLVPQLSTDSQCSPYTRAFINWIPKVSCDSQLDPPYEAITLFFKIGNIENSDISWHRYAIFIANINRHGCLGGIIEEYLFIFLDSNEEAFSLGTCNRIGG
jgi:hypothetical protein